MKHSEADSRTGTAAGGPGRTFDARPPEYERSVINHVYDAMSRTPQAIAVTDGDLEWTYDDLRCRSDLVASELAQRGIAHGSVVGVHLPRCADAIAAMIGIMAAGCVYLPLDPSYPPSRLRYMLDQSAAVAVTSNGDDPELYGSDRIWLPPPSQLAAVSGEPTVSRTGRTPFGPQERAYILFTSGSTGKPKGVVVTHENITVMNTWSAEVLGISASDATATTCSLSFDASFHETLLPLSVGGTVHVISHALALGQLNRPVSLIATTPTIASELLRAGRLPSLKVLMLGGEALAPDAANRLLSSGRVENLLNCYGPTESTVCVTLARITAPVPDTIPIGRPVPGTQVLILDGDGRPLPDGKTGEIGIVGKQVVPGYVNDAARTAERFAVGPAGSADAQRYYRTGDLGYRDGDGLIYFTGRSDGQVKINGHRIELREIDAALRSHPQIDEAATIAQGGSRLVAYVVTAPAGTAVDAADLRKHLSQSLPRFMLPAGIVAVAKLPRTVNGKLDTSALPAWSPGRGENGLTAADDDVDEVTKRVIQIVADVTGFTGQIRPSDDFIDDLGGTSLGIVQVLVELERYSGRRMRINDALADSSVAGLAGLLRSGTEASPADFAFNTDGAAPPLFMIHAYLGGMLGLRRLAESLPPSQPVYGLHVYPGNEQLNDDLTIVTLAQSAAKRIREVKPAGQIAIMGQSAGGLIAYETARALLQAENREPRVLLLDCARPTTSFDYHWAESVLHPRQIIPSLVRVVRRVLKGGFQAAKPPPVQTGVILPGDLMTLNQRQLEATTAAIRNYRSQPYDGDITVVCTWQGRVMALGRRHLGWASVTKRTVSLDAPGSHLSMVEDPHVHTLTERIVSWLASE